MILHRLFIVMVTAATLAGCAGTHRTVVSPSGADGLQGSDSAVVAAALDHFARPAGTTAPPGAVRVRAFRITTWSYEVWDFDLRATQRGFEVTGARRLGGVAS